MDSLLPAGRKDAVDKMRAAVIKNNRSGGRHSPHFICGSHGSGKSALTVELYRECATWFAPNVKVHRIIRYAGATPRSAYNLELLRVICQQISIIYNIPEGYLPKDASFDPLYINNWFQNLLRRCEDLPNEILFLYIDDLHKLNPLDCDIVTAFSWLPISLPANVFLVCSTTIPIEQLKLSPIQKERFKNADNMLDLQQCGPLVRKYYVDDSDPSSDASLNAEETFQQFVERQFETLEQRFGRKGLSRLATYLTCSEYGLNETELLELLMPTQNSEALIDTHEGAFNFSTFRSIRNQMSEWAIKLLNINGNAIDSVFPLPSIHSARATDPREANVRKGSDSVASQFVRGSGQGALHDDTGGGATCPHRAGQHFLW